MPPKRTKRTKSQPATASATRQATIATTRPLKKAKRKDKKAKQYSAPFTSKEVARFYFEVVLDDDGKATVFYRCRCGVRRKMEPNTGYTNLLQHIFVWHSNFVAEVTAALGEKGTLVGFIDDKMAKIFAWIDMVLTANVPFSFCESKAAADYVSIDALSTDSLVKYMTLLTREVEILIAIILPKSFGIILTGGPFGRSTSSRSSPPFTTTGRLKTCCSPWPHWWMTRWTTIRPLHMCLS